ncbi:unannotated protein [freshwater metagenome]|uniref:Unannotated protein n=1 Tax=freshwater metagenome TaxID=449393 RepID=A0A6J7EMR0_9ZZZZ|nr:hypothetical protein [Actinomycetota bacterium]
MWNPLTPAEVVAAMGGPTQVAARSRVELSEWERGQLFSVYSATRHLAAEIGAVEPHAAGVAAELAASLRAAPDSIAGLREIAGRLEGTADPRVIAQLSCEALDILQADGSPPAQAARAALRAVLRRAVELEVGALADAIEGPA